MCKLIVIFLLLSSFRSSVHLYCYIRIKEALRSPRIMDTTGITSPTQSSQYIRTHENFCTQFCAQVDKYIASECPQNNEKYVQQITKILSQLSEERRWQNFTNFVKQKCEKDGGELFSNFVKSWYTAIGHVNAETNHVLPMLLLVMEIMKTDNLGYEYIIILYGVLEEQIHKMNGNDTKVFGSYVAENFMNGCILKKSWLSATTVFIQCMVKAENKFIEWEENTVDCIEYRVAFLLKLLRDVVSCRSLKELISMLRKCSLYDILSLFVEEMLRTEATPDVYLKLIFVLPEVINWKGEQVCDHLLAKVDFPFEDLYMLSVELHKLFESNVAIPKLFLTRLKRHRHLVSCKRFALICLLSLCNTTRYHSVSMAELKWNVVKLQKYCDRLKRSAWIRDVMGDCDVETLKGNLDAVVEVAVNDTKWYPIIGNALEQVALMLLLDKCNTEIKISDGRIVDDAGAVSLGKSILVSLARVDVASIGQLLERLLTILFTCVKQNSALLLIDTIVDIVSKHTVHVLNAWKSLRSWMDSICDLKESIAISLVRALLPVIILRPQLIAIILNRTKKYVLCDSTVATVLPILLLLLRSSTMRSAVKSDYYSQSFATFSTQALQNMGVETKSTNSELSLEIIGILKRTFSQPASVKSMLYRHVFEGIVEAASANQNLVHPTLDLLVTHLATLQQISRSAYIESSKSSTILLEPLSDLVQAVSLLMRLSIYSLRNTSTQVVCGEDIKVCQAMSELDKLAEFIIDRDVHDLQLDKLSDFSLSVAGRANLSFASLMISLYDVFIEHLWNVGCVLTRREVAEKVLALLRRREELNEVLKEKSAKKKESKGEKVTVAYSSTTPYLQSITSIVSRFIQKINEEGIDIDEECLQLLRENAFVWAMDWAQRISVDIYKCNTRAPFIALSSFSKTMLLLYVGGCFVHESASFELWNHKCTQAAMAFSNVISLMISKYGYILDKSNGDQRKHENAASLMIQFILSHLIPKLLETYKDFEERKMTSDFTHQAFALFATCRTLFKQISDEKAQLKCAKLTRNILQKNEIGDKTVLKELWHLYMHIERAGSCDSHYTNFLHTVATQIISILGDKEKETTCMCASVNDITVETSTEMVAEACSTLLSDARLTTEMMSQIFISSMDVGLVKIIDLCSRLADVVLLLLSVHIDYAVVKEPICALLTAQYEALNVVVKLMLKTQKHSDISEWMAVTKLATLAHGSVLRIMENADENVGTLNPLDEPSLTHNRKVLKSQKDETLYVTYVRSRELYQANLLLLCSALHDDRLDIQVRNNSIGVRDFRIDVEKLRQRVEELGEEAENEGQVRDDEQGMVKKRARIGEDVINT
uniref:FANCI_HD2 domain-containing protein n=1 Tax=Elaeophora elaphi TaxID=1147741 RepID=A0A0R3RYF4_9BILA